MIFYHDDIDYHNLNDHDNDIDDDDNDIDDDDNDIDRVMCYQLSRS